MSILYSTLHIPSEDKTKWGLHGRSPSRKGVKAWRSIFRFKHRTVPVYTSEKKDHVTYLDEKSLIQFFDRAHRYLCPYWSLTYITDSLQQIKAELSLPSGKRIIPFAQDFFKRMNQLIHLQSYHDTHSTEEIQHRIDEIEKRIKLQTLRLEDDHKKAETLKNSRLPEDKKEYEQTLRFIKWREEEIHKKKKNLTRAKNDLQLALV
ncbi:MAG: hypothetical protein CMO81_11335 [Waddliaceae bacterium]|nr:hypothetical protein [Waddliaceae bacterium]